MTSPSSPPVDLTKHLASNFKAYGAFLAPTEPPTTPEPLAHARALFDHAHSLIRGDRRQDYGPIREGFERTALIWTGILGVPITATQVVKCMIGYKLYRESCKPKQDNRTDLAGYTGLLEELEADS